ncbi:fatty acid CoA ligase family protein [Nonomuraea gerenzanensis]|uniref:AMP-dependent synthetase/ligase in alkane synthesis cluster n=1 Tax=Nonomuraea gerenzanensis TaxID=93944 RepID=A0A1M4EDJ4_9ACTN|nr:fatty acid CoA ligase family protein [Nonomuraea gerenzanensis]UBU08688.1 AMP-binding protein [Nonomuraea gerenzanensis]SBO97051.1 AMP-dependent synthetase/ligase in alkane synthesis cluster [Nonomuraea gerenzanensis]
MTTPLFDVVAMTEHWTRAHPGTVACHVDRRRHAETLTYAQLDDLITRAATRLADAGVRPGTRTAVMVPPGQDLVAVVLALLRLRAVPVLIDPGLGARAVGACLAEAAPGAFVAVPRAHLARVLLGWARDSLHTTVTLATRTLWFARHRDRPATSQDAGGPALIAFTSGSTGAPKGVPYRHRHLAGQTGLLAHLGVLEPGATVYSTFLPFAVAAPSMGCAAVIPRLDLRRPERTDPAAMARSITTHGVRALFAAPALLDRLARHCLRHGLVLDSVEVVLTAGAPLPFRTLRRAQQCLPAHADVRSVYGATECLLVSMADAAELAATAAATARGAGTCLGGVLPGNRVRVVRITDEAIPRWSDDLLVPPGTVGEITVSGPAVGDPYLARPYESALARIDDHGEPVHRMGDLGWQDERGRLWFAGRKSERVRTGGGELYTDQVEPIVNALPGVRRSALVGVGPTDGRRAVLCVECEPGASRRARREVVERVRAQAGVIGDIAHVLAHPCFPMDVRHASKIRRPLLARWAARRLGTEER